MKNKEEHRILIKLEKKEYKILDNLDKKLKIIKEIIVK